MARVPNAESAILDLRKIEDTASVRRIRAGGIRHGYFARP